MVRANPAEIHVTEHASARVRRPSRTAERGQSLVEMAVGLVILIMLVSGLLDLGRLYYIYIALEDAVGEAALYLSLDPYCLERRDTRTTGDPANPYEPCTDPENATYRAQNAVDPDVIDWTKTDTHLFIGPFEVVYPDDPLAPAPDKPEITVGDSVTVEMAYPVDLLTPVIPRIAGINPLVLRARATQRVIRVYRPILDD